jgi:hypothetical protein
MVLGIYVKIHEYLRDTNGKLFQGWYTSIRLNFVRINTRGEGSQQI